MYQGEIKKLAGNELVLFKELLLVFEDVFEMKEQQLPPDPHLQALLEKDDFFVFVAFDAGRVIGGLTAYELWQYYSELPLVYIYDLAVRSSFQRKGVGTALITAINGYCRERGVEEVFVQAEEADGYALDFYRSTGATQEAVVHFNYPLNSR